MNKSGASSEGWHEIDALFRCEWEWVARNLRGIVPSGQTETPAPLAQGLVVHAARAEWFTHGFRTDADSQARILAAARAEGAKQQLPITPDDEQAALRIFAAYQNHWQYMPKPTVKHVELEIAPTEVVPGYTRTARLDDVSEYPEAGGALCLGEAKTTAGRFDDLVAFYEMHGQPLLQDLLWRKSVQGAAALGPIAGVMLDIIGKPGRQRKGFEFARVLIPINDHMREWFERALMAKLERRKELVASAKPARNPTSCIRHHASLGYAIRCPYRDLCQHGRAATGGYQLADGSSLLDYKGDEAPWE